MPLSIPQKLSLLSGAVLLWRNPRVYGTQVDCSDISVIVPARNEAANIASLLKSLHRQKNAPGEIIVVNDESQDDTATVAAGLGARVIDVPAKPQGWVGKTWACWQGARAANGSLLLFLDADTRLTESAIAGIKLAWINAGSGLLSIQPYHDTRKPYEQLSAFFNLMTIAGMGTFTPLGQKLASPAGFSPCMLCDRATYFSVGGHEAVRGEILEGLALGQRFGDAGKPVVQRLGWGTVHYRMYPGGITELIEGWSKAFTSGARHTRAPVMAMITIWISGLFIAFFGLLKALAAGNWKQKTHAAGTYLLFAAQLHWHLVRIGRFSPLTAVLYPAPLLFFVALFTRSLIMQKLGLPVRWRGRTISGGGGLP